LEHAFGIQLKNGRHRLSVFALGKPGQKVIWNSSL
jgi:hypothetical protein